MSHSTFSVGDCTECKGMVYLLICLLVLLGSCFCCYLWAIIHSDDAEVITMCLQIQLVLILKKAFCSMLLLLSYYSKERTEGLSGCSCKTVYAWLLGVASVDENK